MAARTCLQQDHFPDRIHPLPPHLLCLETARSEREARTPSTPSASPPSGLIFVPQVKGYPREDAGLPADRACALLLWRVWCQHQNPRDREFSVDGRRPSRERWV